jgi:hypothetical protein
MKDLIERLRSADENSPQRISGSDIFKEAADRIEDLERGLNIIAQAGTIYGGAWCVAQALGHIHNLDFDMWPETGRPPEAAKRDLTK